MPVGSEVTVMSSGRNPTVTDVRPCSDALVITSRWSGTSAPPMSAPLSRSSPSTRFMRSEEHTSELQSRRDLVCRLLLEKKNLLPLLAILIPLLVCLLGLSVAGVAQLVEHLICNQRVGGSIPSASSTGSFEGSDAEPNLAAKANGLVSLDTSPICVFA